MAVGVSVDVGMLRVLVHSMSPLGRKQMSGSVGCMIVREGLGLRWSGGLVEAGLVVRNLHVVSHGDSFPEGDLVVMIARSITAELHGSRGVIVDDQAVGVWSRRSLMKSAGA